MTHYHYNPNYRDDRECECGHPYYRHFDTYEKMAPVGCKYCECMELKEKDPNAPIKSDSRKDTIMHQHRVQDLMREFTMKL